MDPREILKVRCVDKILIVAEIMSGLIDHTSSDSVTEMDVMHRVEHTIEYYTYLHSLIYPDVVFDMLPEWLLEHDTQFLTGLLTIAQMSSDDKDIFLNDIADLMNRPDDGDDEKGRLLLESLVKGG